MSRLTERLAAELDRVVKAHPHFGPRFEVTATDVHRIDPSRSQRNSGAATWRAGVRCNGNLTAIDLLCWPTMAAAAGKTLAISESGRGTLQWCIVDAATGDDPVLVRTRK